MAGECDKSFASNYLLLKPEEATIFDLICLLFSSNLDRRKFIDCPLGTQEPFFQRRWVIFVSAFLQKLLLLIKKPLAFFGSVLEHWLNLLKANVSFLGLIYNFIRGKMVNPDEESASYTSILGFVDTRLDLDPNIKPGDPRYNPALSMMAAKVAYENKLFSQAAVTDHWKMNFLGAFDFWNDYMEKAETQAFLFQYQYNDSNIIVVSFRGTEPFNADDWISDVDYSFYELPSKGKVHAGFLKALGQQKSSGWPKNIATTTSRSYAYYTIRETLRPLLQNDPKAKFIVTGHSLGGALAILFPAILMFHEETFLLERLVGIYTFGQPRVGDDKFGEYVMAQIMKYSIQYYRFVYCNDVVPRVPFDDKSFSFEHFGSCIYANSFYKLKIVDEEPNKNYFSILWLIPKYVNAGWELTRGFLIQYIKGKEYNESFTLRVVRLIGLAFPGLPPHCPQDYVNSTRLGSKDIYIALQESINVPRITIN